MEKSDIIQIAIGTIAAGVLLKIYESRKQQKEIKKGLDNFRKQHENQLQQYQM